jgi:glycosyltransferase involved in cell wall biosynthesis
VRVALDVSAVPSKPVGAGMYVLRLAEELSRRDEVDLLLVTRRDDGERWQALGDVEAVVPGPRPARLVWEQTLAPRIRGIDLWHGPHYTMPLLRRGPTVVTIHDMTLLDRPEWHERSKVLYFGRMIRASVRRADALVSVSHHTARRLEALLHPRPPVVAAPLGVATERFHPDGPDDARRLGGLGIRRPFIAFAGTLEPRKDVPALVRAFDRLDRPELQLVLAGGRGWGADAIDAAVAASPRRDQILRPGYVDDAVVPALFRQAAAVGYPSLEEGFGLPALEALACGAALVTTTGSAMEDVVDDAALLVPPGDDAALAAALDRLLAGGPDVERLQRRGPEVAATFTWAACADAHVDAYRLAMERGTRGHAR